MPGPALVGSSRLRCSRSVVVLWLAGTAFACSVQDGAAGDECLRSTECASGLVCIEGICSDDLSSIADPGTVPMFMPETAMEPEPDAGELPDGAMATPTSDAAMTD